VGQSCLAKTVPVVTLKRLRNHFQQAAEPVVLFVRASPSREVGHTPQAAKHLVI